MIEEATENPIEAAELPKINLPKKYALEISAVVVSGATIGILIFLLIEWLAVKSFSIAAANLLAQSWRAPVAGIIYGLSFYLLCALPIVFLRRATKEYAPSMSLILVVLTAAAGGSLAFIVATTLTSFLGQKRIYTEQMLPLVLLDAAFAVVILFVLNFITRLKMEKQIAETRAYEARLREQTLESAAIKNQVQILQSQINPHFLFNTLNALSALISLDPQAARETVGHLSEMFRYTFAAAQKETVSLIDEIGLVENYLSLEKARLRERLDYKIEVAGELKNFPVPSLVLQPIVENAVKYGIARRLQNGRLEIKVERGENQSCRILVCNEREATDALPDFNEAQVFRANHSLENVRKRLRLLYGERFRLVLEMRGDGWIYATLELPQHDFKE